MELLVPDKIIKAMKLKILFILILFILSIKSVNCVESLTLIEKRAILIKIIISDFPDLSDQAIEYICSTKDLISQDLNKMYTFNQIRKYAVFIRYLCHITSHLYDNSYSQHINEVQECHTRYISNWQNVFF